MDDLYNSTIFNSLLLATIVGEFLLPWILKRFYNGYDSKKMVMSALGSPESPVRGIYNTWLIWLGMFLLIVSLVMFPEIKKISTVLAALVFLSTAIFAVGAGILAGLFSVNESKENITTASKIHGVGSAIGFMTLMFLPLLSSIAAFMNSDILQGIIYAISFVLALLFFAFFIMGDKDEFKNTIFAYEGLWERLSLFFMYIPFICTALNNLLSK